MPLTCQYYKIEKKKSQADPDKCGFNEGVPQFFYIGKCTHEKCSEQAVSCYGLVEFCQISDIGGKD